MMRMPILLLLLVGASFGPARSALAQQATNLTRSHMDFRMQYSAASADPLGIVLRFDAGSDSFTVSNWQTYIVGGPAASNRIPPNPNFAFLGPAGAPICCCQSRLASS